MGASYFCMLGFPQAWLTRTGRVVLSPRVGMQLLRKHQAHGVSFFSKWERNEGGLSGLGGARQTGDGNLSRTPSSFLAFLRWTRVRLGEVRGPCWRNTYFHKPPSEKQESSLAGYSDLAISIQSCFQFGFSFPFSYLLL